MKRSISLLLLFMLLMNTISVTYADSVTDTYTGEFLRSQTSEEYQQNPVYYINVNGHELYMKCTQNYGSYGTLYADGKYIDDNVLWNYFSDGNFIYYTKDDKILRANIETGEKEHITSDNYAVIEGVYKNKYLYYGSDKYSDITYSLQDLIIYDIENKKEITYVVDVGDFVISDSKIYTTPCTGDISELPITEMNLDGSQPKQITDDATLMKVINNQLYYSALDMSEGYYNIKEQIRKYDSNTGITKNLTEYNDGYVTDISSEYAIFENFNGDKFRVDYKREIKVVLNGEEIEFDQPPVMINDRVMVPIRAIFEAMGYTVNWNGETQTAEAIKLNNNIIVQINNNIILYTVNEKSGFYECDVVPQIISGRTLVPVRAIAESAGCDVQWDGENTTVIITYYENSSNQLEKRNAKALLLAGYDDDEDANKKQNHLDANRLSVDFVEEALNYLNITDVEKHYMEDHKKNMSALELVEILQNTFKNATDNDLSIIYYSGHTYTNHTTLFSEISFQNFYNLIKNNIKGTVLLIYDGCFAGELLNLSEYDDRIKIIAACDEDDYSSSYYLAEIDESSDDNRICSIFAYALYNGAINNMNYLDSNNDKTVAFDELYVYLLNSVYNICDRITTQEDKLNRLKDMLGLDSALRIAQIVQAYPNSDTTPLFTIK